MPLTRRGAQGGGHISSSMAAHMQQPMAAHAHMQQGMQHMQPPLQHMQPPPTYHQQQAPPHTVPHTVPHDLHEPYPPPYPAQYQQNAQHEQPPPYDPRGPLPYDPLPPRAPLPPLQHQASGSLSQKDSLQSCCTVNVGPPLYSECGATLCGAVCVLDNRTVCLCAS